MNTLIHPIYYTHAYYGNHHSYGATSWVTHMIVSAMVHAVIYGAIFHIMRELSLPEILVLVGVVLIGVYLWARRRDRMI